MFEPFRRLGPARTGPDSGQHGLGLSIVRAIAQAHHAEIDAQPRPGGGLVITVAFPAPA
jgi:signal transduction histidine kinase